MNDNRDGWNWTEEDSVAWYQGGYEMFWPVPKECSGIGQNGD